MLLGLIFLFSNKGISRTEQILTLSAKSLIYISLYVFRKTHTAHMATSCLGSGVLQILKYLMADNKRGGSFPWKPICHLAYFYFFYSR